MEISEVSGIKRGIVKQDLMIIDECMTDFCGCIQPEYIITGNITTYANYGEPVSYHNGLWFTTTPNKREIPMEHIRSTVSDYITSYMYDSMGIPVLPERSIDYIKSIFKKICTEILSKISPIDCDLISAKNIYSSRRDIITKYDEKLYEINTSILNKDGLNMECLLDPNNHGNLIKIVINIDDSDCTINRLLGPLIQTEFINKIQHTLLPIDLNLIGLLSLPYIADNTWCQIIQPRQIRLI